MKMRNIPFHGASGYSSLKANNLTFKKVVKKVMRDRSYNQFMVQMENMLRRIVREELGRLIRPDTSSSLAPMEQSRLETPSSRQRFKLRFINSPPPSIFTGAKIEADGGSPVAIELVDAATNARVVSGPLSSSRVEIVPLNADFTDESWTVDVFKRNILKQREAKRPLLTGDITLALRDGVGVIAGVVAFSDNSSWTRSRKFRLGARLTGGGAVEARSAAFKCKDQRGESYQKHYPPSPSDEVWRLDKIAKGGVSAMRLGKQKIYTVKDFRRWYAIDPNALYTILDGAVSKRKWDAIVFHAKQCVLDETECYVYDSSTHDVSLLFNSVYEVTKVFSGGALRNADQVPSYLLDQYKLEAYQNLNRFRDGRTFVDHPQKSLQCPQNSGFGIACPGLQHPNFQGISGPSDSSRPLYFTAGSSTVQPDMLMSFENSPGTTFHIDGKFLQRNSFRVSEHDPVHRESQTIVTGGYTENDEDSHESTFGYDHYHDMPSNWSPGTTHFAQQAYDSLCVSVSGTQEAGTFDVRIANIVGSPRARWCKVKAAFKLREVWRTTARRRGKACKKPCLPY
ncbi:unnamed protein product [Thlaspi arvense]|uniref:Uncharacterized protein n=1 Tax=Thlaspi arvense TaxID=13288 RepID=A0AAU9RJM8_THLAR|nr:unnamed protein product [Thlaspi arvense]